VLGIRCRGALEQAARLLGVPSLRLQMAKGLRKSTLHRRWEMLGRQHMYVTSAFATSSTAAPPRTDNSTQQRSYVQHEGRHRN
jgi:hypothetical protein